MGGRQRQTIRNVDTNTVRTLEADGKGRYNAPDLPVGNYEIQAEIPGFQTMVQKGIQRARATALERWCWHLAGHRILSEFRVLTNTYGAQYGGNGAIINSVTRSGTNSLHRSAYEYVRNDALDDPTSLATSRERAGTIGLSRRVQR